MSRGVVGDVGVCQVLHSQHSLRTKRLETLIKPVGSVARVTDEYQLIVAAAESY